MATYLLTEFSPYVDAYRFNNSQWDIGPDEAKAIFDAFKKVTLGALALRPPFLDAFFDMIALGLGPLLADPTISSEVEKAMSKFIDGFTPLDAANPAFCCGMCFAALDAYTARVPNARGTDLAPKHDGSAEDAKLRKYTLDRHVDAWTSGGAITTTLDWKLTQKTQGPDALRHRSAGELTKLLAALRRGEPVPLLVHQLDDESPFSTHCIVAYGAKIEGTTVELLVYDPNDPVTRDEADVPIESVARLVIQVAGSVDAPTSISSLSLTLSSWNVFAFTVIGYSAKPPPLPVLAQASGSSRRVAAAVTISSEVENRATGTIGPFVVAPRASLMQGGSAPAPRETIVRIGSRRFPVVRDSAAVPSSTPTVTGTPPTYREIAVVDRSPNPAITLAPKARSLQELTILTRQTMLISAVAQFTWRSGYHAAVVAQADAEKQAGKPITSRPPAYVRRIANTSRLVGGV